MSIENTDFSDPELIDIDINSDDGTQFKILTWNVWCMICAPRTLSNPQRCGNYVQSLAKKEEWSSFDGLIVCNFQELWAWRTGLFPPIALRLVAYFEYIPYLGVLISFIFQLISLLFGVLPIFKCLPIKYDPKSQLSSTLHKYVPYAYSNCDIPLQTVLDNGLLLLSNHKADKHGSFGYVNHACDDSMAYKGCIYAYFKKYHTLVLNTHLQSAGDGSKRMAQVEEVKQFIHEFTQVLNKEMDAKKTEDEDYNRYCNEKLKIIACGDWNVDMTNHTKMCHCNKSGSKIDKDVQIEMEMEKSVVSINDLEFPSNGSDPNLTSSLKSSQEKYEEDEKTVCNCISRSQSYADLPMMLGLKFMKVNGDHPTCKEKQYGCLDHIFVDFDYVKFKEEVHGKESKLSDHLMVKNEFTSSRSNMNPINLNISV